MKYPLFCLRFIFILVVLSGATTGSAQYYYKDIVVTQQSQDKWKTLRDNKVRKVTLQSLERDGQPTPGFVCTQSCSADYKILTTYTTSSSIPASTLLAFYDKSGRLMKTIDSSDTYVSTTRYEYDAAGRIAAVKNLALETDNKVQNTEDHLWVYRDSVAVSMLKIKNGTDSTTVSFKSEEGNISEEQPVHGKEKLPATYYYYDQAHRITDIVKYNLRAQRLLPDYMFSYENDRLASMIFVPAASGDYENWQYEYDQKNLKFRETCRNKKKETIAVVNYNYSFQ